MNFFKRLWTNIQLAWSLAKIVRVGQVGQINVSSGMTYLILFFILILFVINFVPVIEAAITASTVTDTTVTAILELWWIAPVLVLIGGVIAGVRSAMGKRG